MSEERSPCWVAGQPCPGCPSDLDGNGELNNGDLSFLLLLLLLFD